jgi:hypothetical protein
VRLEIDGEPTADNPTAAIIRDTLGRLSSSGPAWAVLDIRPDYYIQTRVFDDGAYAVEYREGGADRHYRAFGSREAVVSAFIDYLGSGSRWRTAFEWRRVDLT